MWIMDNFLGRLALIYCSKSSYLRDSRYAVNRPFECHDNLSSGRLVE